MFKVKGLFAFEKLVVQGLRRYVVVVIKGSRVVPLRSYP